MDTYIKTIRKPADAAKRFFNKGVSVSAKVSVSSVADASFLFPFSSFTTAPYPAALTAAITSSEDAAPSTPMEFVKRLTEHDVTPATFPTAFSTRALQAAQLMPVT